ncbi:MAG: retropepsin-like aspartic protease [bacterium]
MLVKDYPFITTRSGDIARPYLPITITNPENENQINVYALIDTGADECALPASFASLLKHNLQAGYQKKINTGNGITIAYSHTICIKAFGYFTKNVLVDFMPNLNIPLLGTKSFLSNFVLNIDYPKKTFSIIIPK